MAGNPKKASDHEPYAADQKVPYYMGASKAGQSLQSARVVMPADGVVTFAAMGLMDMENTSYRILIQNHSDVADEATVTDNTKTTKGFTIAGPDAGDLLDVFVQGTLKGQVV